MVGCDGLLWHQRIADYRLYADGHSLTLVPQRHQGKFAPVPVQKSETGETSKEQAKKIAEQMIPLEEKIKMEQEAREAESPGTNQYTMRSGAPESPDHKDSKKVAVKIAEKAGVSPRTV